MDNDPTIRAAAAFAEQAGKTCKAIGGVADAFAALANAPFIPPDAQAVADFLTSLPPPRAPRASLLLHSVRALTDRVSRAALAILTTSAHHQALPLAGLLLATVERLYAALAYCETP